LLLYTTYTRMSEIQYITKIRMLKLHLSFGSLLKLANTGSTTQGGMKNHVHVGLKMNTVVLSKTVISQSLRI